MLLQNWHLVQVDFLSLNILTFAFYSDASILETVVGLAPHWNHFSNKLLECWAFQTGDFNNGGQAQLGIEPASSNCYLEGMFVAEKHPLIYCGILLFKLYQMNLDWRTITICANNYIYLKVEKPPHHVLIMYHILIVVSHNWSGILLTRTHPSR